jgi:hypothetical protein
MLTFIYSFRKYILLFILIFGVILNSLSFLIMRRVKTQPSFFISILAVVDTGNVLIIYNYNFYM